MEDMAEILVPLAAIFFVFGLPMITWLFFRVMAHRERMAAIAARTGYYPTPGAVPRDAAPWPSGVPAQPQPDIYSIEDAQCTLRKGIRLTFIGFAVTMGLSFIGIHDGASGFYWHPGPWLLGGLVPLFIGLAQIMIALMSGATFGPLARQNAGMPPGYVPQSPGYPTPPPPPSQPQQPSGAQTFDQSYTYRPGTGPTLPVPPMPPDRR